jgi:YVTN family beta-propeller protein
VRKIVACLAFVALTFAARSLHAQTPADPSLDFEFFRVRVQPIFLAKRPGHARCVSCHAVEAGSNFHPALVPLAPGQAMWDEASARKNFAEFSRVVVPESIRSKLLVHPLAADAGGDAAHNGGKHFSSQDDPEWQTLKAWVFGAKLTPSSPSNKARILQTNSAGDNIHVIDPATNQVVGEITGIETNHGVAVAPDGSRLYVTSESGHSLHVVDGRTLAVTTRIALSGKPNNVSIAPDGKRVYVGIRSEPGGVDVIDTASSKRVKTIPTKMTIHNTYVTPDGKYILAGSVEGNAVQVIDAKTETLAWNVPMGLGVRPIAMTVNADGSTKWLFVQLNDYNGFAVVDFAAHKEIKRLPFPPVTPGRKEVPTRGEVAHGLAITKDGKTLLALSRLNAALYAYSIPDLTLTAQAELEGRGANWLTLSPDGARAYVSNTITDNVSVVDVKTMKDVMRIPVGVTPKRNTLWMVP